MLPIYVIISCMPQEYTISERGLHKTLIRTYFLKLIFVRAAIIHNKSSGNPGTKIAKAKKYSNFFPLSSHPIYLLYVLMSVNLKIKFFPYLLTNRKTIIDPINKPT